MAENGAREGEVCRLRVQDLIEKDRTYAVRLSGKTGERYAPVTPATFRRLKAYATTGRPRGVRSDRVFVSLRRDKRTGDYEGLSESCVYQLIRDAAERAGLLEGGRRIYPHLLRHSAVSFLVAKGVQPMTVADIVGCSIQVAMAHYNHSTDETRYEALVKALAA
jgi:integrase